MLQFIKGFFYFVTHHPLMSLIIAWYFIIILLGATLASLLVTYLVEKLGHHKRIVKAFKLWTKWCLYVFLFFFALSLLGALFVFINYIFGWDLVSRSF